MALEFTYLLVPPSIVRILSVFWAWDPVGGVWGRRHGTFLTQVEKFIGLSSFPIIVAQNHLLRSLWVKPFPVIKSIRKCENLKDTANVPVVCNDAPIDVKNSFGRAGSRRKRRIWLPVFCEERKFFGVFPIPSHHVSLNCDIYHLLKQLVELLHYSILQREVLIQIHDNVFSLHSCRQKLLPSFLKRTGWWRDCWSWGRQLRGDWTGGWWLSAPFWTKDFIFANVLDCFI